MTSEPTLADEVFELHRLRPRDHDGSFPLPIVEVSGLPAALADFGHGLPSGPAGFEALAVRLRRAGATVRDGVDVESPERDVRAALCDWGAGSVRVVREDFALLPDLVIGTWLDGSAGTRAARGLGVSAARLLGHARLGRAVAFWSGVRAEATEREWRRLTRGYSALLYHRLAGELKRGQERIDVPPRKFDAQMRVLRVLRARPLTARELASVHAPNGAPLAPRSVLVTLDDALADVCGPLARHASVAPLVFVPSGEVGARAHWLDGEPVATWDELSGLAQRGASLGGHSRTHPDLSAVDDDVAREEIHGSAADLERETGAPPVAFAYPYGRFGARERELVEGAGFAVAFGTQTGLNGAARDRFALRRVSVKAWDSRLSFAWKVVTGEQPPAPWERWLLLRAAAARRLARRRPPRHSRA